KEGESLESVYERLTMLVNIMDRNNIRPISVSINTKFLNCLQPEWSKYVTMVCHNQTGDTISYDQLYDSLVQFEPHIQASKAKRAAWNHDPLALIAHSNASYNYQGELQGDSQEDKLTTAMMLLARAITQKFSTPTNNRLRTSSNTRNQAVIQDGRVDIQTKNAGYGGNGNRNAGRQNRNQAFNAGNVNDESHYARDCQKPRVRDAKYFREQMLLAMKDEAGSNLKDEENDFMLDNAFGDETLKDLMLHEVNALQIDLINGMISKGVHEHKNHGKRKTVINTSDDDQIDSNIIFDDPYVENNGGSAEHDSNDHDQYHDIQILAYNVQREAENHKRLNNELKKQKELLQKELETCQERVKNFEYKMIQCSKYKEMCDDLEHELRAYKDTIENILKEKDKIESDFFKVENEKTHNKVYDPFLKAGLGYQNPERLMKAIVAQQKMYHGEMLQSTKLKINSPDSEETLDDAEESRLKMKNKMVQLDYEKLNALYETFVS
ncbi:hypothetical protein Tco_1269576, partial [Tanacetum coccineum]